jgi:hypothetical protein
MAMYSVVIALSVPEPVPTAEGMVGEPSSDTKLSPAQLGRVDWTDEMLNWITKYEMIVVALPLVSAAAPCGNAPMRHRI